MGNGTQHLDCHRAIEFRVVTQVDGAEATLAQDPMDHVAPERCGPDAGIDRVTGIRSRCEFGRLIQLAFGIV